MSDAITILCVEDDSRLRSVLERLLGQQADMRVLPGLERADGLCDAVRTHTPAIVLLDLNMPGVDPLAALAALTGEGHSTRVIVLSGSDAREHEARAVDAGAWAVLNKAMEPSDLLHAIRRVAAGEVVLPE